MGRTARADVAKRLSVLIASGQVHDSIVVHEEHLHVGHDILGQTNEEAGKWIKTIIARVVDKQLEEGS